MAVLRPTKHKHEVPELFREPHVETGFRPLHQPWWYYIASLFQPHNECLNTWTHLIGVVLTLSQLYEFSQQFDLLGDPYMWPLLSGMTSMLAMYCCSTGAHWFQSRSELVHFTCFMIDYAGIGLYGLGSTQLHYAYSCDQWLFSCLQTIYLPVGIVLAILTCLCCSISKTMYHRPYPFKRKIWQIGSVAGTYIWLILPVVHRLFKCWQTGEWEDSMEHHVQQMLWFMTSGFFYGSDIPQRFYPGKFDFLGHSHQMFHLCVLMTSYKQMDSLVLDIRQYHDEIYARPTPTFCSTFGAVLFATLANILVVRWFREYVKRSNRHITCTYPSNGHSNGLQNGVHTSHAKHE